MMGKFWGASAARPPVAGAFGPAIISSRTSFPCQDRAPLGGAPVESFEERALSRARLTRWLLAGLGVGCVALGAVGAVVPGLPTTVFVLIAAWCFAKSCPVLERALLRNKLFAPAMRWVDRAEPVPARVKGRAVAAMWAFSIVGACVIVLGGGAGGVAGGGAVLASACVGTVVVVRWDARPRDAARAAG